MHVHQPQSQNYKPGKLPALREVKHPHKGRTSVSRFPLAKQGISSHDSGCFEGIGHFTRDPCRFHLKSDLQLARHASEEVNTEKVNTHWVHSYRMERAKHFPAPMEMCIDDHHTHLHKCCMLYKLSHFRKKKQAYFIKLPVVHTTKVPI